MRVKARGLDTSTLRLAASYKGRTTVLGMELTTIKGPLGRNANGEQPVSKAGTGESPCGFDPHSFRSTTERRYAVSKHRIGGNADKKDEVKVEKVKVLMNGKVRLMLKSEWEEILAAQA